MTDERRVDAATRRRWGRTLAARRKQLELSQQSLAKVAGVKQQTISVIERGLRSPTDHVRIALAKALQCQVEEIFDYQRVA